MDDGADDQLQSFTASPMSMMRLPSSVAAPVQPQPPAAPKRRRKRKKKNSRRKKKSGGGGSLCQIIGICDLLPSATQENPIKSLPQSDVPFASSQVKPLFIEAPKAERRVGEKTAAEIAALFHEPPIRAEDQYLDSQFAASSFTNTLSIDTERHDKALRPLEHSYQPAAVVEIDFSDGQKVNASELDSVPETYRATHFGQDVSTLEDFSNVPISSINFEVYERQSKMIPDHSPLEKTPPPDSFKLEEHNLDQEAKTWRPLKVNKAGLVERTDYSESSSNSDWVPKLGPDVKVRQTYK